MRRWILLAVLATLFVLLVPTRASGATDTLRTSLVKDRPIDIDVARDGIRITKYYLSRVTRGHDNPFKIGDGPSLVFVTQNESTASRDFAIAVALFDRDGRLVGASTGKHFGKLDPGESKEVRVEFKDVERGVPQATTMFMTLETQK